VRLFLEGKVCPALAALTVFYRVKTAAVLARSDAELALMQLQVQRAQHLAKGKKTVAAAAAAAADGAQVLANGKADYLAVLKRCIEFQVDCKRRLIELW
jgi:hypothetical protein